LLGWAVKLTEGPAFRIDQTAPTGIAFRYVRPEDKYPFLTTDVADRVGVGRNRVVGLAKLFGLKGKDDFHTSIKVSWTSSVQRYSQVLHRWDYECDGKPYQFAVMGKELSA
jgi:hypothetical protein